MLGEIDESMRGRYYPFILEDIVDFYDRIKAISTESNSLSLLLSEINQNSETIFQEEKDVGTQIEIAEFEKHVSSVNEKIAMYQKRETALLGRVTSLYEEVKQSEENCGSDIQNTIPLSEKEAEVLIAKQQSTIASLMAEKKTYEASCKDLGMRLSQLEEETKEQGVPSPLVDLEQRASVHKSLLWLYSLKRIMRHSLGIFDVQSEGNQTIMKFDDGRELVMKTDDNGKLCEAKISWQMPHFDDLLQRGIGNDWSLFVTDLMYMMYSSKRYTNEIEALRLRFVIDDDSFPIIHVTFSNFIVVCLKVPEQYPRTLEKVEVDSINSIDIDRSVVYHLQSMLRNKQFFTITDIVEFIDQIISNKV